MRDFPVFDTQYGVGALILREIPYRKTAYIHIHSASDPEAFLRECLDFSRAVGAEHIYATGHECLKGYPEYTAIWKMATNNIALPNENVSVFPVTEKTAEQWQIIYNEKMKHIPCSAYLSKRDMSDLVKTGGAYFVHRNGQLLGLGKHTDNNLDAIISMQPGAGAQVVAAMAQCISDDRITLEVASQNHKAIALYERMGFIKTEEKIRWYIVSGVK